MSLQSNWKPELGQLQKTFDLDELQTWAPVSVNWSMATI